ELMQVDAARLVAAAQRGRERVARASQTLRAVGDEVRATASTVAGLSGMSERIGGFAQTIARIARQTHLLARNAAIEAARAQRLAELAQSLQQVAAISSGSSQSADGAAAATQAQITSMGDLTATSQQLAQLAERLRASIARFSVLRREQEGQEPPVARAAAD